MDQKVEKMPDNIKEETGDPNVELLIKDEEISDDPPTVPMETKSEEKTPNPALLKSLVTMGMDKQLASKALVSTGNSSVDEALTWIGELGAEEMEALCGISDAGSSDSESWEDGEEDEEELPYKMVFVVNSELGMGAGKVSSQVGHAALGLYRVLQEDLDKYQTSLEEWEEFGEKMITLRGENSHILFELQKKAESLSLPTYMVKDAGLTQIPSGSTTVLSIFGDEEAVNEITGNLKLL